VLTLVGRARQRLLHNELLSQGVNASSAALIALILLLLLGTQVLNWRWAVAIPVVAAGAGLYAARRRLPSPYTVAQMVDHRMGLADTLSTALYFSEDERRARVSREIRQCQWEQAERLSQTVDVRKAVPYSMPRTAYLMAALLAGAAGLFALRYGLSLGLDLKPPLAGMLRQKFGGMEPMERARSARPKAAEDADWRDGATEPLPDAEQEPGVSSRPMQETGATIASNSTPEEQAEDNAEDAGSGERGGQPGQGQNRQSAARQGASESGESASLLTKVEDAIENLLSSLKPPRSFPGARPQSGKEGSGQQSKAQQSGGQPGDSQEGRPGEETANSQDSQGKSAGTRGAEQTGRQPGSGIGSEDGDKNILEAERLAAMGKISEIIGKRSANVTGEATAEAQSTSQHLRTPYAQRGAQHTQGGAAINRDEIPAALQTYVEQYFEQVRQPAPPRK